MTFLEAALQILRREGRPLHYKEIADRAVAKQLLTFIGRTPDVTMQTQLTAVVNKSPGNPFVRSKPGYFGLLRYPELSEEEKRLFDRVPEPAAAPQPEGRSAEVGDGGTDDGGGRGQRRRRGGRGRGPTGNMTDDGPDSRAGIHGPHGGGGGGRNGGAAAGSIGADALNVREGEGASMDEDDVKEPGAGASDGSLRATSSGASSGPAAGVADASGFAVSGAGSEALGPGRRRRRRRRRRGGEFGGPGALAGEAGAGTVGDDGGIGPDDDVGDEEGDDEGPLEAGAGEMPGGDSPAGGAVNESGRDPGQEDGGVAAGGDTGDGTGGGDGSSGSSGPGGAGQEGRRILMPIDAAIEILRGQAPGRGVHVRQIADAAVRRRLVHGEPHEAWRVIRAALAAEPKERLRNGLRPRVRAAGSGLFALTRRPADMDLEKAEHVFGEARRALRERTLASLEHRLSELAGGAFEALGRVLLQREGFGPATFVKRVEGTVYLEALRGRGFRPSKCLIALRPGGSFAGRRSIGELRAGVRARNLDEGVILLAGRLADDGINEWKQSGSPIEVADGPALAESCVRHGVGVVNAVVSVDFVDADFFAELSEG